MEVLPHALFRAAQVRELDRLAMTAARVPGYELMERAGGAAFSLLRERWPDTGQVAVICGAGNNAGDGYVLARFARAAGLMVRVLAVSDPQRLRGDARQAYADWCAAGGDTVPFSRPALEQAQVVVDALLGTGLARTLEGEWRAAVATINTLGAPILAIDVPSGLHADTGAVLGAAVRATATISFIGLKQGMFTGEGPEHCGELHFDALGVPKETLQSVSASAMRIGAELLSRVLPRRSRSDHKGRFGHVLVVGGDAGMAGAARMAGEAAGRCGAGLVSIATRPEHAAVIAAARPELMCHGVAGARQLAPLLQRANVVAIGPGLGRSPWARELLSSVLECARPLVVDADALNLLADEPMRRDDWILTPHPGEAARLLGSETTAIQADRFAAVEALVDAFSGTCVLKGAGTLVRGPLACTYVCDAGNPGMASGGMGDVLTGVLAALVAQGLGLEVAARAGAHLHAAAADRAARAGERGLLALDLMSELRILTNPGCATERL